MVTFLLRKRNSDKEKGRWVAPQGVCLFDKPTQRARRHRLSTSIMKTKVISRNQKCSQ